jgi:Tfp pilus assembly protein PilX
MKNAIRHQIDTAGHQSGVITTFTGVMILLLLTLMMFFAMRVGVFEQRVSSNEMRQKNAFHTAESGIQHAKEYFKANRTIAASSIAGTLGDGTDGWLVSGGERWQPCPADSSVTSSTDDDVCSTELNADWRAGSYYWSYNGTTSLPITDESDPSATTDTLLNTTTETVDVQALLCVMIIDAEQRPPVRGCSQDPSAAEGGRYLITLLSRGEADCTNWANCGAEVLIREQISDFGGSAGGQAPAVPLTTKNMFPPSGAAEIVANPNGGGVGVPISVWMNRNPTCAVDGSTISPSQGSWATCEAHEWYGLDSLPDDAQCPGSCSCAFQESLSYTHGTEDILGIDLVQDEEFPCDLFQFYFGTPRDNYESVKGFAEVLSDCSTLGPGSSGIYWISGEDCDINANSTIGSPYGPVLLISAATTTRMAGGATIFGVLYVADVEDSTATFESQGNNIVYGQVILDAEFGSYNGTFQVVYNENLLKRVAGSGALGNVLGGWTDFQPDWQ